MWAGGGRGGGGGGGGGWGGVVCRPWWVRTVGGVGEEYVGRYYMYIGTIERRWEDLSIRGNLRFF